MKENRVKCSTISVDCAHNDPVDIRCGGPEYLGFDFFVKQEDVQEMMHYIILLLARLEVPMLSIYEGDSLTVKSEDVWTKERIVEAVKKQAEFIKNEATRGYNIGIKK